MHCITFALHFVILAGLANLFFNKRKRKSYMFGNCKGYFPPEVNLISLRLKKASLHLIANFSQHGDRIGTCVTDFNEYFVVNLKVMHYFCSYFKKKCNLIT